MLSTFSETQTQSEDLNVKDIYGSTPLHKAARSGDTETATRLIEWGADINVKDTDGDTPLHNAARSGDTETARLLIDKGADINVKDTSGDTPLHNAARSGDTETARLLIEKGADINAKNTYGYTPLHLAVYNYLAVYNKNEMVVFLALKGADIALKDRVNKSPISLSHDRLELVRASIRHLEQHATDLPIENSRSFLSIFKSQPALAELKSKISTLLQLAHEYQLTEVYGSFKSDSRLGHIIDSQRHDNANPHNPTATRIKADKIIQGDDPENQNTCGCGPRRI